jgi:uncharacterized membrane protein HdeD (DUF308 family)
MIHNYKAPPTKWWPIVSKIIDVVAGIFVAFSMVACMFKHEWTEGIYWGVFACLMKLHDIKERLDD